MHIFNAFAVISALSLTTLAQPFQGAKVLKGTPVYLEPETLPNQVRSAAPTVTHQYQAVVLTNHNVHRSNHSANALTWNYNLVSSAQVLAQRCEWQHNTSIGNLPYGQNLAAGWPRYDVAAAITDGWYDNEMPLYAGQYGKATPDMSQFDSFGHFTQLVWKGTTSVGCVSYNCANSPKGGLIDPSTGQIMEGFNWFTVCNYSPPGNYLGEFNTNVAKPLGHPGYTPQPF